MKTEAIEQLIGISKVAYDEDVSAAAKAELAALEASLHEWEEREAACCPEDRGFEEVIAWQRKQIAVKDEALRMALSTEWHSNDCQEAFSNKLADENVPCTAPRDCICWYAEAEAALSPQTDKEWVETRGMLQCPICESAAGTGHDPTCAWESKTGKRLVDVEKLQEAWDVLGDVEDGYTDEPAVVKAHELCEWLAALLKEAPCSTSSS